MSGGTWPTQSLSLDKMEDQSYIPTMTEDQPILALTERGVVENLLSRYRKELTEAAQTTENSVKQLRSHLATLERNSVAIAAQSALLTQLENDLTSAVTAASTKESNDAAS